MLHKSSNIWWCFSTPKPWDYSRTWAGADEGMHIRLVQTLITLSFSILKSRKMLPTRSTGHILMTYHAPRTMFELHVTMGITCPLLMCSFLLSSSRMNAVAKLLVGSTLPKEGFCSTILKCSMSSMSWSSTTGTITCAVVEPGAKVTTIALPSKSAAFKRKRKRSLTL